MHPRPLTFMWLDLHGTMIDVRNGGPRSSDVCLNHALIHRILDGGRVGRAWNGDWKSSAVGGACSTGVVKKYVRRHDIGVFVHV
jgi:hypothetical protein